MFDFVPLALLLSLCINSHATPVFNQTTFQHTALNHINRIIEKHTQPTLKHSLTLPHTNTQFFILHTVLNTTVHAQHLQRVKQVAKTKYVKQVDTVTRRIKRIPRTTFVPRLHTVNVSTLVTLLLQVKLKTTSSSETCKVTLKTTVYENAHGQQSLIELRSPDHSTDRRTVIQQLLDCVNRDNVQSNINNTGQANFTLLNLNVWNHNYWNYRFALLIRHLHSYNPTFITLQEVRLKLIQQSNNTWTDNQMLDIAAALGDYEFVYQPAMLFWESPEDKNGDYVSEGVAIMSRRPIVKSSVLKLSRNESDPNDFHQRILLQVNARLAEVNRNVSILTTHFSLCQEARQRAIHEIGQYLNRSEFHNTSLVLTGDFNAVYNDSLYQFADHYGLKDCWIQQYGLDYSWLNQSFTFNSWQLNSRIDYIFIQNNSSLQLNNITLTSDELIPVDKSLSAKGGIDNFNGKMFVSDHRAMFANFVFLAKSGNNRTNTLQFNPSTADSTQTSLDTAQVETRASSQTIQTSLQHSEL